MDQESIAQEKLLMRGPLDALLANEGWRNDEGGYGSVLKWFGEKKDPSWLDIAQREGLKIAKTMLKRLEPELDTIRKQFGLDSCKETIKSMQNYFLSHGEECPPDHYALMADSKFFEENTNWSALASLQENQRGG
jgi:hypothetical protein